MVLGRRTQTMLGAWFSFFAQDNSIEIAPLFASQRLGDSPIWKPVKHRRSGGLSHDCTRSCQRIGSLFLSFLAHCWSARPLFFHTPVPCIHHRAPVALFPTHSRSGALTTAKPTREPRHARLFQPAPAAHFSPQV